MSEQPKHEEMIWSVVPPSEGYQRRLDKDERQKHEWRIDARRFGIQSSIYLDGEMFPHVQGATLQVGHAQRGTITTLTLELSPRHVAVIADPELHLIVGTRRFRVIEESTGGDEDVRSIREL